MLGSYPLKSYPRKRWGNGATLNVELLRQDNCIGALGLIENGVEINVRQENGEFVSARIVATAAITHTDQFPSDGQFGDVDHPLLLKGFETSLCEGHAYLVRKPDNELRHFAVGTRPTGLMPTIHDIILVEAVALTNPDPRDPDVRPTTVLRTVEWLNLIGAKIQHNADLLTFGDMFLSAPYLPAERCVSCTTFTPHHEKYTGTGFRFFDFEALPFGVSSLY
jgi:hypothetical protein